MTIYLSILLVFVSSRVLTSHAIPHNKQGDENPKVLFDQRQEGEVNIRADLKNFVIMIIPKSPKIADNPSSGSLLDLLSKKQTNLKRIKHIHKLHNSAETMHFIESKSAPYHVDITKSSDHLLNDEILATQTPPVVLPLKPETAEGKPKSETIKLLRQLRSIKFAKAFVLTVPEEEFVLTNIKDKKIVKNKGLKKISDAKSSEEEMLLIGATEQCGPEMRRDSEGICRMKIVSEHAT